MFSSSTVLRNLFGGLLVSGAAVLLSTPAAAEKDGLYLGARETAVWDSNPLMLANGASDIYGSETRAFAGYAKDATRSNLNGELALVRNQYNKSAFNSTDIHAKGGIQENAALWAWGLDGSFDYDTSRSDEITTFGQALKSVRRVNWSVAPTVTRTVSARSKIQIAGNWQERHYDGSFLTDYRVLSATPSWLYSLSPLQTLIFSLQARRYSTLSGPDQTVDSIGPSAGWRYQFRPDLTLDLSAGFLASKFDGYGPGNDDWQTNPTYAAQLSYDGQIHDAVFRVSQERQPYANGTETELTTISAKDTIRFHPRWTLALDGAYQLADKSPGSISSLDSAFEDNAALTYKVTEKFSLGVAQKFRHEDLTGGRGDAERHIIKAQMTYRFGPGS